MCRLNLLLISILIATAAVLVSVEQANAGVVFSEDFEGGTDPQLLSAAPYSWNVQGLVTGSTEVQVDSTNSFLDGLSINGSTGTSTLGIYNHALPAQTAGALSYTVTADVFAAELGNGHGTHQSGFGFHKIDSFPAYGTVSYDKTQFGGGWYLDIRGLTGIDPDRHPFSSPVQGVDKSVVATVSLDLVTNQVTGSIFDGTNTYSITQSFPAGAASAIDSLVYISGANTFHAGSLDIDNIVVSEGLPEIYDWAGDASGDWSVPASWSLNTDTPDSNEHTVNFGDVLTTTSRFAGLDNSVTVNRIEFNSSTSAGYAVSGPGDITLETKTSDATAPTVEIVDGDHQFQTKVSLTDSATVDVVSGSTLDFNNEIDLNTNTLDTSASAGTVNFNHSVVGGGAITASAALGTAGSTSIAADLTLSGASTLAIDLGNLNTDHFDVTGNVVLDALSVVDVTLEAGFVPSGSYTVLTASGTLTDNGLTLDASDTGLFSLAVLSNTVVLTALAGVPGDFDGNGVVDGADFLTWQRDLGDVTNLGIWQANYGTGALAAAAGAAAVPEPTSLLLTIAGVIGLTLSGGRRSRSS